jgi:hypothetical protein
MNNENEGKIEQGGNPPVSSGFDLLPKQLAKVFYESKIFKDVQSEAQAIVKILAGRELGIPPIQAMNVVYIAEGKVGYETKILLSKLKKSGKYDYAVTFTEKEGKVESASVEFFRIEKIKGAMTRRSIGVSKFSIYDAARIGLINRPTYKNYPNLMLFYRAASNGMTMFCPDILDGIPLIENYVELTENEQETVVSFKGNNIEIGERNNGTDEN